MFGDPTPWASHAYEAPEWVNNVTTSATTLYHVLFSFNKVERHVFDNCYDGQITTMKFSIFTFIENKVLGKDLYSQSQSTFARRIPEKLGAAADTAWKQFFNTVSSSKDLTSSSNEVNENYYMVGSKILQHYLSCPDGVSAYKESLPSAQRFAKKFDNSTHYLELIAAQMVTNKSILAAAKPKPGKLTKEKPEDSGGLESDVDTDKDSKNKRHKVAQGSLESEFRVFASSMDAAFSGQQQVIAGKIDTMVAEAKSAAAVAKQLASALEEISNLKQQLANATEPKDADIAALKEELGQAKVQIAVHNYLVGAVGTMMEDEEEGGATAADQIIIKKHIMTSMRTAAQTAKNFFQWDFKQTLEFFAPLNLPRLNSMIKDLYSQPV